MELLRRLDLKLGPLVVVAGIAFLVGLIALIGVITGFDKTSGGEIAVVRNGGAFDDHKVRQVIDPASSLTWRGFWSSSHKYPAQQRFYTITSNAKGAGTGREWTWCTRRPATVWTSV